MCRTGIISGGGDGDLRRRVENSTSSFLQVIGTYEGGAHVYVKVEIFMRKRDVETYRWLSALRAWYCSEL